MNSLLVLSRHKNISLMITSTTIMACMGHVNTNWTDHPPKTEAPRVNNLSKNCEFMCAAFKSSNRVPIGIAVPEPEYLYSS